MYHNDRIKLAVATLTEIEKVVSRTMPAPEVNQPLRNDVMRDRIANAVRIYCANEVAFTIGNTGPV